MSCKTVAKCFLIGFNIIFFLLGILMVVIGAIALAAFDLLMQLLNQIEPIRRILELINESGGGFLIRNSAIYLLVIGCILLLIGVFGCGGALCNSKCMIITYLVFLIVITIGAVGLIVYVSVDRDGFNTRITSGLRTTMGRYQGTGLHFEAGGILTLAANDSDAATFAWDLLQMQIGCCGAESYADWAAEDVNWSAEYRNVPGSTGDITGQVPLSCCKTPNGGNYPARIQEITFDNPAACLNGDQTYINSENCFEQVINVAGGYNALIYGILGGITGVCVIQIICSICLVRTPSDDDRGKVV